MHVQTVFLQNDIVRHVDDQAGRSRTQQAIKILAHQFRQHHAVGPRVARRHAHGLEILLRERAFQAYGALSGWRTALGDSSRARSIQALPT